MALTKEIAKKIVVDGDVSVLVTEAQSAGEAMARQLTSSQIRNIFGEVRRIEMSWKGSPDDSYRRAVLLQPKLTYQAKRSPGVQELKEVLDPCIEQVRIAGTDDERYRRFLFFVDFFEAILAYAYPRQGGRQ
jgi:CRISPR-associated protein Csm2